MARNNKMSRSSQRWLALGMFVVGFFMAAMPWFMLVSAQDDHDAAVAQQAWITGDCVVTGASIIEVPDKDGGPPAKTLAVTFELVDRGRRYEGLSYTYPTYAGGDPRQHAEGMHRQCYYDGNDPTRATLMRKGAPTEPRPDVSILTIFFTLAGAGLLIAGIVGLFTRKRWKVGGDLPHNFGD